MSIDPFNCPHFICEEESIDRVLCGKGDTEAYTNCRTSVAGEPPQCVHEPLDNSPEAMERRLRWTEENE